MAKQKLFIDQTYRHSNRLDFFKTHVAEKKVLHVGFVDYPKPRPHKNLHLMLYPFCKTLDGVDPNVEYADSLKVPNGEFFKDWTNIDNDYDVILVPEVLEHVENAGLFLQLLDSRNGTLIITVPDAYLLHHHFVEDGETFVESVHSDHKCWYSPYTLSSILNSSLQNKKLQSLHWLANHSICAVCK